MNESSEKLYYGNIESDGIKLHYARTSLGLRPVVFLHGMTDNGSIWGQLAAALYQKYDIFLPDARGHGLSQGGDIEYSLTAMTDDAANFIRLLELDRPVVIGHSMGASVAGNLAAEYPNLVRAIILIDPTWYEAEYLTAEFARQIISEFEKAYEEYHQLSGIEMIEYAKRHHPNWSESDILPWAKSKQQYDRRIIGMIPTLAENWPQITSRINIPALIMTGDPQKGSIVSQKVSEELLMKHSNWESIYFEDAGHNIQRDQFEKSRDAIVKYLAEIYS